ncbi:hypothetical protein IGI04_008918 [Brassica rapa subsp. trilocularis]|uniref:Uncharacterized protein n=1 Tax=Brassica rapa subsp. trilocularis TaxID=1813537 RepID=A0ABQ7MVS8_BRACM|nr:hypothetical protein IGI04_008918 [Brassica rapa subsp. trilocularis]
MRSVCYCRCCKEVRLEALVGMVAPIFLAVVQEGAATDKAVTTNFFMLWQRANVICDYRPELQGYWIIVS